MALAGWLLPLLGEWESLEFVVLADAAGGTTGPGAGAGGDICDGAPAGVCQTAALAVSWAGVAAAGGVSADTGRTVAGGSVTSPAVWSPSEAATCDARAVAGAPAAAALTQPVARAAAATPATARVVRLAGNLKPR